MDKILVLGSSGFVGKNISEIFSKEFTIIKSVRDKTKVAEGIIWFDLLNEGSWIETTKLSPSIIINCIGYGVVKTEKELDKIYDINYIKTVAFFEFLSAYNSTIKLIHFGTAFEYDLSIEKLLETSNVLPQTHYGISKLMASNYLFQKKIRNPFVVIRPFNMFGLYEDESKIIPYLILSQKNKVTIDLSSGKQKRDYCFVEDLVIFLLRLVKEKDINEIPKCINVGTGVSTSIKEMALKLSAILPSFDSKYWNWDAIPQRIGEQHEFYNASTLSKELGFKSKDITTNLQHTINYYWKL